MLAARCHPQNTIPKTKAQCAKGGRMYPNAPPSIQWRSGRRAFGTVCRKWKHCKGCEQRVDIISGPRICSRTWSANSSYHRWHGPDQGQKRIFCLPFDNISLVKTKLIIAEQYKTASFWRIFFSTKYFDNLNFFQTFVKALREIANPQGSSIQNVERHLRKVYSEVIDPGFLFEDLLRSASKKAVTKNLASHDGSFTYFKSTSAFKKQSLPSGGGTGTPTLKPKKATNTLDSYLTTSKPKAPSIPSAPILEDKYEDSVSSSNFHRNLS